MYLCEDHISAGRLAGGLDVLFDEEQKKDKNTKDEEDE
jgi:hypothetical protein